MAANKLDLGKWVSQAYLADKLGITTARITTWTQRGKIRTLYVKELRLTLVSNINDISDLKTITKKV